MIKKQDKSLRKKLMKLWTKRIKRHEENAKKSKITGYRDFHLRCAKLIKTVFRHPLPVVDDDTDTEKHDKTVNRLGRFFPKPEKKIRTMPTLKSNSMSDLELTLQLAKSLPSESSTRLAKVSLFVFVALRPKSTAMVIAGRSVHLSTLFPGRA